MIANRKTGSKTKPFIVDATTSAVTLDTIKIKEDCIMGYTKKGWVTQSLLIKYLNYILPFGNALLIWDHCSAHEASRTENIMSEYLANKKIKCLYIPKGATGYFQVADVAIIRSLKCNIRKSIKNFYTEQVNNLWENSEFSKVLIKPPIGNLRK
eukprot:NODE_12_length_54577_cov_0.384100.p26 type:complete len:154 gc:universal NODE_12_length_54577_cov_0.384100:45191-44730(-)